MIRHLDTPRDKHNDYNMSVKYQNTIKFIKNDLYKLISVTTIIFFSVIQIEPTHTQVLFVSRFLIASFFVFEINLLIFSYSFSSVYNF